MTLQIHRAANWLPELPPSEYAELKADIQARGQLEPILVKDNHIIDGRHRYKVCRELGIFPSIVECDGDIIAEILSRNILRRHLTSDQRAALVAKLRRGKLKSDAQARMKSGVANPPLKSAEGGETADKIAKEARVGRDKARLAVQAAPVDLDAVIAGKARLAKLKPKRRKRPQCSAFERSMMGGKTFQQVVEARYVKFLEYFPVTRYPEVAEIVRGFIAKVR